MIAMLSRSDFFRTARTEAARVHGRKHAGLYNGLQFAPYWIGLGLLGALGYGAWWLWDKATSFDGVDMPADTKGGLPLWLWVALALTVAATFVAFRPGRPTDRLAVLALKGIGLGLLWLWLAATFAGYLL